QRSNQLRRVDQELQHRIAVIASVMRRGPDPGRAPPDRPRPFNRPPIEEFVPAPGNRPPGGPEGMRGREGFPSPDFIPPAPLDLRLAPQDLNLFQGPASNTFYYIVWNRDGR